MALTYEYAVLTAIPNPRRGERVNVGVVVFRGNRADVHFREASYKLRALTGESWEDRLESASARLVSLFDRHKSVADAIKSFSVLEPLIKASEPGWLKITSDDEYDARVQDIIKSLVGVPRRDRIEGRTRINTEIVHHFRKLNIIAGREESIDDHKLVRNYEIDSREGLHADFALKNGRLHIASTLDLRRQTVNLGDAALKSIVLEKAGRIYASNVRKIGIYAVDKDMVDNFSRHIAMLSDYADEVYNWLDRDGRQRFQKSILDALRHNPGDLI